MGGGRRHLPGRGTGQARWASASHTKFQADFKEWRWPPHIRPGRGFCQQRAFGPGVRKRHRRLDG